MNTSSCTQAPRAGAVLARPWLVEGLLAPATAGFVGTRMPAEQYVRAAAGFVAVNRAGIDATVPSGHRSGRSPV